jgi:hypothetical protein
MRAVDIAVDGATFAMASSAETGFALTISTSDDDGRLGSITGGVNAGRLSGNAAFLTLVGGVAADIACFTGGVEAARCGSIGTKASPAIRAMDNWDDTTSTAFAKTANCLWKCFDAELMLAETLRCLCCACTKVPALYGGTMLPASRNAVTAQHTEPVPIRQ